MLIVNESACVLRSALPLAAKPRFREALIKIPPDSAFLNAYLLCCLRRSPRGDLPRLKAPCIAMSRGLSLWLPSA
jgi:hypothetical protein